MISSYLDDVIRSSRVANWSIWVVISVSIGLYGVVAWVKAEPPGILLAELEPLPSALAVTALLTAGVSLLVPRFLLSDKKLHACLQPEPNARELATNAETGVVDLDSLAKIQALDPSEQKLARIPGLYFTPFILRIVLNDAIAIYGLVLSFMTQTFAPIVPYLAVALLLNLTAMPRLDGLMERASQIVLTGVLSRG
jgi:hypothetical protein